MSNLNTPSHKALKEEADQKKQKAETAAYVSSAHSLATGGRRGRGQQTKREKNEQKAVEAHEKSVI